jgi:hypothetical protein
MPARLACSGWVGSRSDGENGHPSLDFTMCVYMLEKIGKIRFAVRFYIQFTYEIHFNECFL